MCTFIDIDQMYETGVQTRLQAGKHNRPKKRCLSL